MAVTPKWNNDESEDTDPAPSFHHHCPHPSHHHFPLQFLYAPYVIACADIAGLTAQCYLRWLRPAQISDALEQGGTNNGMTGTTECILP